MSLNEKQVLFTKTFGRLLSFAARKNISLILAEAYRTPEQAKIYAEQGKGITKSCHTKKLAVDLFIYKKDGTISWDPEDYRVLGEHWKSLHELARWGGDFKNRDAVHFSFEHNGVT
jgi:hypothetical protein